MFQFTRKPSSGSHNQYLAKNTGLVQCSYRRQCYGGIIWPAWCVCCALHTLTQCTTHATQVILCRHNTDICNYIAPSLYF